MTALTRESIATLSGRELDAAVAERVFGVHVLGVAACANHDGCWHVCGPVEDDESGHIPRLVYAEHPGDPWAGPDFAGLNYPRLYGYTPLALGVVTEYHCDWNGLAEMIAKCTKFTIRKLDDEYNAIVLANGRCGEDYGSTLPEAFARAMLLTTLEATP